MQIACHRCMISIRDDVGVARLALLSRRALPALILGGICIGCSPIFVRLSELGPIATAFWRLALALIPLLFLFSRDSVGHSADARPRGLNGHLTAAAPGVFIAAELVAWHISLHMTSVANSTLLVNMAPIFVTLGSWVLLRKPVSRIFIAGLALAILGVGVLKGEGVGGGSLQGDLVALFAAVLYAGYMLLLDRARKRYSTSVVMMWSTTTAAFCILPVAFFWEPAILPLGLIGWAILFGLAWISHAGGQGLITFALAWLPPTFSSLTLLLQPVVAALLAWLFLGEALGTPQIAGGLIVIAGIVVARRG